MSCLDAEIVVDLAGEIGVVLISLARLVQLHKGRCYWAGGGKLGHNHVCPSHAHELSRGCAFILVGSQGVPWDQAVGLGIAKII